MNTLIESIELRTQLARLLSARRNATNKEEADRLDTQIRLSKAEAFRVNSLAQFGFKPSHRAEA